jgi:hypothetical protein
VNSKQLFYFAGQCLTQSDSAEFRQRIITNFNSSRKTVYDFIQLCDENFILPTIYFKLKKQNLLKYLPSEVSQLLTDIYTSNKSRNTAILKQINEINKTLEQKNIFPVYLKGCAHLLDNLYSDIGERMIRDIDFLVKEDDFIEAGQVLMELGYKKQFEQVKHWSEYIHFPAIYRDDYPAAVEIHRLPTGGKYLHLFSPDFGFNQLKKISSEENCFVQSDEHQFILNVIHSQRSHSGYLLKKSYLRDMYDLYLLSQRIDATLISDIIKEKTKFEGYFIFTEKVLDIKGKFGEIRNLKGQLHCFLSDVSLSFSRLSNLYISIIFFRRSFIPNLKKMVKMISDEKYRDYILRKYNLLNKRSHSDSSKQVN